MRIKLGYAKDECCYECGYPFDTGQSVELCDSTDLLFCGKRCRDQYLDYQTWLDIEQSRQQRGYSQEYYQFPGTSQD